MASSLWPGGGVFVQYRVVGGVLEADSLEVRTIYGIQDPGDV